MRTIQSLDSLKRFLKENRVGILADTGFLYAVADIDDRLNEKSLEVYDLLEDLQIPVYFNVVSRMEFVDLIFRKQLTIGAIKLYEKARNTQNRPLINFLKNIRDENTAHLRAGRSYKLAEGKLKKLRNHLEELEGKAWKTFCNEYAGDKLSNEWGILEEELGLEFIELLEGEVSEIVDEPLIWSDMVQIMGREGLRANDAMIVNLFVKSRLPLLITTDRDIVKSFLDNPPTTEQKSIFHLD